MCANIFAQHHNEFRVSCVLQPLTEWPVAPHFADLAKGAKQRTALQKDGEHENHDRDPDLRQRLGVEQLVVALVDREQAAHAKQQDGDNETPEIAELAVAEWMLFVGGRCDCFSPR